MAARVALAWDGPSTLFIVCAGRQLNQPTRDQEPRCRLVCSSASLQNRVCREALHEANTGHDLLSATSIGLESVWAREPSRRMVGRCAPVASRERRGSSGHRRLPKPTRTGSRLGTGHGSMDRKARDPLRTLRGAIEKPHCGRTARGRCRGAEHGRQDRQETAARAGGVLYGHRRDRGRRHHRGRPVRPDPLVQSRRRNHFRLQRRRGGRHQSAGADARTRPQQPRRLPRSLSQHRGAQDHRHRPRGRGPAQGRLARGAGTVDRRMARYRRPAVLHRHHARRHHAQPAGARTAGRDRGGAAGAGRSREPPTSPRPNSWRS